MVISLMKDYLRLRLLMMERGENHLELPPKGIKSNNASI